MGAEWTQESDMETTWYPGNSDEATQQILVTKDMPSNWHGEWNRTLLGKAPTSYTDDNGVTQSVVDPFSINDIFEDLQRLGFRLRVTWIVEGDSSLSQTYKKVREGRIKKFSGKWDRIQDIKWEVQFDWLGRGRTTQRVLAVRDGNMTAVTASLNAQASNLASLATAADFIASNSTVFNSANRFTLGQLETFVNVPYAALQAFNQKVQQIMTRVQQAADVATSVKNLPFAVANKGITAAQDMVSTANAYIDQVGQTPPELMSLSTKVSTITRAAQFYAQNKAQAALLSKSGQDFADRLRARQAPAIGLQGQALPQSSSMLGGDIIAIHITKANDTPQKLSMRYYQSPDHGADILRANKLPLYQPTFAPGRPIIIPVLQTNKQGA